MSTASRETALAVLARVAGKPRAEIRDDMNLVGDLGIDSPKALELLLELEEALGREISDEDASALETVRDVLAYADQASCTPGAA